MYLLKFTLIGFQNFIHSVINYHSCLSHKFLKIELYGEKQQVSQKIHLRISSCFKNSHINLKYCNSLAPIKEGFYSWSYFRPMIILEFNQFRPIIIERNQISFESTYLAANKHPPDSTTDRSSGIRTVPSSSASSSLIR